MKWTALLIAAPLLLTACDKAPSHVEAEVDADFAKGDVMLTCKVSSSGTCYAIFIGENGSVTAKAAAGQASGASGVTEGMDYCVEATEPDPSKCRPRPLAAGQQIVRRSSGKS